jgi:pimeloyl-ACP methyl ester carboxylesterase/predicted MFS family arabinose efflux permease
MSSTTLSVSKGQVWLAGSASILGWAIDLYDLLIILYVATAIAPLLFPPQAATLQLAYVYGSFAISLIVRPLGSGMFGVFADKKGRKKTMMVTVSGVGISTFLMGAVPTYAVAGALAPLLFLLLRVVQGIFVGGLVAATHTLGTETAGPRHRGLMSGLVAGGGAGLGAVMASIVYLIVSQLFPGDAFATIGWRVMFFSGLVTSGLSLLVYSKTQESPFWAAQNAGPAAPKETPANPLFSREHLPVFFLNMLVVTGGAALYYLTLGFLPTFLIKGVGMARSEAALVLIVANLSVIAGGAIGGTISDRIGRRRTFLSLGSVCLVVIPMSYVWLAKMPPGEVGKVTLCCVMMGFFMMAATAPIMIYLNERFPTKVRATGTALCWNIGYALGGMTPMLVAYFSPQVADVLSRLVFFSIASALLFIVGALFNPKTDKLTLEAWEPDTLPGTKAKTPGNGHRSRPGSPLSGAKNEGKETVVLLHSLGTDSTLWDDQVSMLSKHYRVLTPDSRGHGGHLCGSPISLDDWIKDLDTLIAPLQAPVHMVGLSMGGIQAIAYASRHPGKIRSLVLASTFPAIDPAGAETKIRSIRQSIGDIGMNRYARQYLQDTLTTEIDPAVDKRLHAAISGVSGNDYILSSEATFRANLTDQLKDITAPTLVMIGDRDKKTPLPLSEILAAGIPKARLAIIPDAGHLTNIDAPHVFNKTLLNFIGTISARKAPL